MDFLTELTLLFVVTDSSEPGKKESLAIKLLSTVMAALVVGLIALVLHWIGWIDLTILLNLGE